MNRSPAFAAALLALLLVEGRDLGHAGTVPVDMTPIAVMAIALTAGWIRVGLILVVDVLSTIFLGLGGFEFGDLLGWPGLGVLGMFASALALGAVAFDPRTDGFVGLAIAMAVGKILWLVPLLVGVCWESGVSALMALPVTDHLVATCVQIGIGVPSVIVARQVLKPEPVNEKGDNF